MGHEAVNGATGRRTLKTFVQRAPECIHHLNLKRKKKRSRYEFVRECFLFVLLLIVSKGGWVDGRQVAVADGKPVAWQNMIKMVTAELQNQEPHKQTIHTLIHLLHTCPFQHA